MEHSPEKQQSSTPVGISHPFTAHCFRRLKLTFRIVFRSLRCLFCDPFPKILLPHRASNVEIEEFGIVSSVDVLMPFHYLQYRLGVLAGISINGPFISDWLNICLRPDRGRNFGFKLFVSWKVVVNRLLKNDMFIFSCKLNLRLFLLFAILIIHHLGNEFCTNFLRMQTYSG